MKTLISWADRNCVKLFWLMSTLGCVVVWMYLFKLAIAVTTLDKFGGF